VTDEFFHRLQQYVPRYIRETVQRHAQEAQAEIDRLGRVSEATAEQRKAEAAAVRRQLTDWTELSRQIKLRGVELASLPATPPAAN
jgi:glutamyl-tRNA reductase